MRIATSAHRARALTALMLLAGSPPLAEQRKAFHAETNLVVLNATVRDRRGDLVTNLERSAFTVYENGTPQPIAVFRRDDVPVSLGILIDNSGSMRSLREKVEAAALAFVRLSNPDDEVFVVNFADKPRLDVPLTRDRQLLEAGIARTDSIGGTAMRDAIEVGETYLAAHATNDRKALLVMTDGKDNASIVPASTIREHAERSDVVIYAIRVPSPRPSSDNRAYRQLRELAERTGGLSHELDSIDQLDQTTRELASQIRRQYTIAYTPLNQALDGTYRKIRVVAKGPVAVTVRTRVGYYALRAGRGSNLSLAGRPDR
jgi:Ca-activated chloride channel homolog